jgi:hypothetical protein
VGLLRSHAIYSLDGYHITVDGVHDPVLADSQPVISAPVESIRGIRISARAATAAPMAAGVHRILTGRRQAVRP